MNVVLLPGNDEDWSDKELGYKQQHEFSSRMYKFMVNEYEGIGTCQTHSLYSPMREFSCHEQAVSAAQAFLEDLKVERELTEEERVDEELLGKVLREEEIEVDLDAFDEIKPMEGSIAAVVGEGESEDRISKVISRRNLLRGNLR